MSAFYAFSLVDVSSLSTNNVVTLFVLEIKVFYEKKKNLLKNDKTRYFNNFSRNSQMHFSSENETKMLGFKVS